MNRVMPEVIDYYDNEVTKMIMDKKNKSAIEALKMFVCSKTHKLLENLDSGFLSFGASGIFDIWENEVNTGDFRNSIYISGD